MGPPRSDEYARAFDDDEPLVTIIITTYNNWPLLRERSLPSVLAQTYQRFECIVVGDAAPAEAAAAMASFGDARLRFVNLPYRGPYPPQPSDAWLVSGTTPFNTGLALAKGRWTGSVSDDDALSPGYIESLLGLARAERAEVAYGVIHQHEPDSDGTMLGTFPPQLAQWGIQCSLFMPACATYRSSPLIGFSEFPTIGAWPTACSGSVFVSRCSAKLW